MVYTVTDSAKDSKKIYIMTDEEAALDAVSCAPLLEQRRQTSNYPKFCVFVPWVLLLLCFMMLASVSSWGWREHFRLQELIAKTKQQAASSPPEAKDNVYMSAPYGNDGLVAQPEQPPKIKEIVIDEEDINVVEENTVIQENPLPHMVVFDAPLKVNDDGLFLDSPVFPSDLPLIVPDNSFDPCAKSPESDITSAPVERIELPKMVMTPNTGREPVNS